jgi:hypothetical protein
VIQKLLPAIAISRPLCAGVIGMDAACIKSLSSIPGLNSKLIKLISDDLAVHINFQQRRDCSDQLTCIFIFSHRDNEIPVVVNCLKLSPTPTHTLWLSLGRINCLSFRPRKAKEQIWVTIIIARLQVPSKILWVFL